MILTFAKYSDSKSNWFGLLQGNHTDPHVDRSVWQNLKGLQLYMYLVKFRQLQSYRTELLVNRNIFWRTSIVRFGSWKCRFAYCSSKNQSDNAIDELCMSYIFPIFLIYFTRKYSQRMKLAHFATSYCTPIAIAVGIRIDCSAIVVVVVEENKIFCVTWQHDCTVD